jgi:hypothetical protein
VPRACEPEDLELGNSIPVADVSQASLVHLAVLLTCSMTPALRDWTGRPVEATSDGAQVAHVP